MKQVDLYLIHNPMAIKDLETDWREFEKIQEAGFSKFELIDTHTHEAES